MSSAGPPPLFNFVDALIVTFILTVASWLFVSRWSSVTSFPTQAGGEIVCSLVRSQTQRRR